MKPTDECEVCGTRWIRHPARWEMWSLRTGRTCVECKTFAIDEESDIFAGMTPREYEEAMEAQRQADAEREARGSCAVCKHYKPDPEAGRRYFGEPNAESGWCNNVDPPFSMLSGDWCQSFERRA